MMAEIRKCTAFLLQVRSHALQSMEQTDLVPILCLILLSLAEELHTLSKK